MTIGNTEGTYFGEWAKIGFLITPNGRGALVCKDKFFFGFTERGQWLLGKQLIVVEKSKKEFKVLTHLNVRPNAATPELCLTFDSDGVKNCLRDGTLTKAEVFESEAGGFISFRGKYTRDVHGYANIGEHDKKNKLTGRGIIITPSGNICLGNFKDGQNVPGNSINIYFNC